MEGRKLLTVCEQLGFDADHIDYVLMGATLMKSAITKSCSHLVFNADTDEDAVYQLGGLMCSYVKMDAKDMIIPEELIKPLMSLHQIVNKEDSNEYEVVLTGVQDRQECADHFNKQLRQRLKNAIDEHYSEGKDI